MLFVALFCDFCETGLSPVAYRRFIYDETTKLGFGLSQQERLALQFLAGCSLSKRNPEGRYLPPF
ncbi:hypothetical protein GG344DRAFT_80889 [Lentinula edodes]|nr:hypothetical protein GG344DRAFT_80889 [Lentinula edodes]